MRFSFWGKNNRTVPPAAPLCPSSQITGEQAGLSSYELTAAILSDAGCHRAINEDCGSFQAIHQSGTEAGQSALMVVADGMGGHAAGEVASRLAVETVSRLYQKQAAHPTIALEQAFLLANQQIYQAAQTHQQWQGMGTTCTALAVCAGLAFAAHVGDSRLYLVRNQEIYLMSEDHSAVMEQARRGVLTPDEARTHPDKNVVLRALGTQPRVQVTTWHKPFPLRQADQFLLCSDGLSDLVADEEIKGCVLSTTPSEACERLVELAKNRGGYDNITVGLVRLTARPPSFGMGGNHFE
jgi:protein phosphatase